MYGIIIKLYYRLKSALKSLFDLSQHHAKASFSKKYKNNKKFFFANPLKIISYFVSAANSILLFIDEILFKFLVIHRSYPFHKLICYLFVSLFVPPLKAL